MHSAGLSTGVRMRISVMGRILVHLVTFFNTFSYLVTSNDILAYLITMVQLKCSHTINIAGLNLGCDGVIWVQWLEWPENWF